MAYKRLEDATFTWPAIKDGMIALNHARFEALLAGLAEVEAAKKKRAAKAGAGTAKPAPSAPPVTCQPRCPALKKSLSPPA